MNVPHETLYRHMALERADGDEIYAALSSETPVERGWGTEILVHEKGAVDLSRAVPNGLPLLWGHDSATRTSMLGRVRELTIGEDRKLRGRLEFSKSAHAQEMRQDVLDGSISDVSIGYRLIKLEDDTETDTIRAVKWQPYEASLVAVPADPNVGVNRSEDEEKEHHVMSDAKQTENRQEVTLDVIEGGRKRLLSEGRKEGIAQERARIAGIHRVFSDHKGSEFRNLETYCVENDVKLEKAKDLLLELLGNRTVDIDGLDFTQSEAMPSLSQSEARQAKSVSPGQDSAEKFHGAAVAAILLRDAGISKYCDIDQDLIDNNYLRGYTLVEMLRESNRLNGISDSGSAMTVVGQAFLRAQTTSHGAGNFPYILADVANKSLQVGYQQAPVTWNVWCGVLNAPDFKTLHRPVVSGFSDLTIVRPRAEYTYGDMSDLEESYSVDTYGKIFSIDRQSLVNDDANAFSGIAAAMGRAAARVPNTLAYGILTANANLGQDSTALFAAGHGNLVGPGSGAGPSIATLDAGFTAMAKQTDPQGIVTGIVPRYLITPVALNNTARLLATSTADPDQKSTESGGGGTRPNTFQGRIVPVADALLDTDDPLQWYLAADSSQIGTVEVAFLGGQQTPYMEQETIFAVDGVSYKVRLDCGAKALDYRGLYQNDGN